MRPSTTTLLALFGVAKALLVTEGSPCSSTCGNVLDSTEEDELICRQEDYEATGSEVFQTCIECELQSDYANDGQSDAQWMLYNLRYAVSYCLFGYPSNDDVQNTPCMTSEACGPFEDAIKHANLSSEGLDKYDYCAMWPVSDIEHVDSCVDCLQIGSQQYLANFVTVLQAGCMQQPDDGVTVAIDGEIFSKTAVNISDPASQATINPDWFDNGPLNIGAKAGIVAGGIVVLLFLTGCCIIWRGKRKRRAFLQAYSSKQGRSKGWPSPIQTTGMKEVSDTPLSQHPLRTWDESPMSQYSDQAFPRYFSPYSSQYNSPVSATDAPQPQQWPSLGAYAHLQQQMQQQQMQQQQQQQQYQQQQYQQGPQQSIGLALGGVAVSSSREDLAGKGKERMMDGGEAYEMQRVDSSHHGSERMTVTPGSEQQHQQQDYFSHSRSYSGSYRNFSGRRDSGM